ncbi:MAG: ABC transporter ATP-binding protein [Lautropia sp.]
MAALALDTLDLTKRFGAFTALDRVSISVRPGTVHALLGENGAGKSTLVKCIVGFQPPDAGSVLIDGRERAIDTPAVARELGIGMVYQHFTVVPGMTVAENLLMARGRLAARIRWKAVRAELDAFIASAPFRLDLDATPLQLSAGEKQKLEILKQLFLGPRLLILDEPTSVLTPQEADEVLGALRVRAHAGECSVILITHKFREVTDYADAVTVLRRGRCVGSSAIADTDAAALATMMVGTERAHDGDAAPDRARDDGPPAGTASVLSVRGLRVAGDRGGVAVDGVDLDVCGGEIVGVAGVAGNGQRELMEALVGQRERVAGDVRVGGARFGASRSQNRAMRVRALPEEPLRNACVPAMSIADNLSLRRFDESPWSRAGWRRPGLLRRRARELIARFGVRARGETARIDTLSGGNVQRAVLARELSDDAALLLVSNPVFGLDFTAVRDIHRRLRAARDAGAAILMVSEDLDELLQLADRLVVMSAGRIVHRCDARGADRFAIGRTMGGAHATPAAPAAVPAEASGS